MTDKAKNVSQPKDYKLIVEKDVKIPMRDGAILYADVFRPDGGSRALSRHHEHRPVPEGPAVDSARGPGGESQSLSRLGNRQSRCGGARAAMPACGSTRAARANRPASRTRARTRRRVDFYDAIEWVAKLPWCSGNIGTLGRLVPRQLPVARGQPAAAVAEGDHSVGRARRSLPRPDVSRRHLRAWASCTPGSPPTWRTT